jgi:hypothetical protein
LAGSRAGGRVFIFGSKAAELRKSGEYFLHLADARIRTVLEEQGEAGAIAALR